MTTTRLPIGANVRWLAAAHLVVKPIWFVFLLLSTRLLGAEQFGLTMLAVSFVSILMVIVEGGIDIHVVRELSNHPDRYPRLLVHSGLLKFWSGVLVAAVALALSFLPSVVPFGRALLVPALFYALFNALMLHARAVFRAFEIMQFEALSIVVEKTAVLVICGAALLVSRDAVTFLNAWSLAYGVACLVTLGVMVRKLGLPRGVLDARFLWDRVVRPGLPFALMNVFAIVYFRSATLILSYVTNRDDLVGYFNAGYRLVESYMLFPAIIMGPLYPVLARRWKEGAALSPLLLQAVRAILMMALLITIPLALFRADFTRLFYGDSFAPAAPALGIVVLAMIPVSLNFIFGSLVAASGRQSKANVFIVLITGLNVAANFLAIPRFGVIGAAVVTVATEGLLALANMWITRDFVRWKALGALAARLVAPAVVTVLAVLAGVGRLEFPLGPIVVAAILVVGYAVMGVVTIEDLRRLTPLRKEPA